MPVAFFRHASFALAAAVMASGTPAVAQAEALQQLDDQLPGDLINDPTRIDWVIYGATKADVIRDDAIPGGKAARRFEMRGSGPVYEIGAKVPLLEKVRRGDTVTVGFYARKISEDGAVRIRFQRDVEPYRGFGEQIVELTKDWKWHEVTAKADMVLDPQDGIMVFQFGQQRQIIEIGQVIIVKGAEAIAAKVPVATAPEPKPVSLLPAPLEGAGTLLNAPDKREWWIGGSGGRAQNRDEETIWLGKATRFEVADDLEEGAALIARVPVEGAIMSGDNLLFAIAARDVAEDGDGAVMGITLVEKESGKTVAEPRYIKFAAKWQLGRIEFEAPRDFNAGEAELMLIFTDPGDRIEVGPVYIIRKD